MGINRRFLSPLLILLTSLIIGETALIFFKQAKNEAQKSQIDTIATTISHIIQREVIVGTSATSMLEALLVLSNFKTDNFDNWSKEVLALNNTVSVLQLAPNGVIGKVYPLEGNEKTLGHDLLADPKRTLGAKKALESQKLTFIGPVRLIQNNRLALIARKPIYQSKKLNKKFWGFSIALIYVDNLVVESLKSLEGSGLRYQLVGSNPDSPIPALIAQSEHEISEKAITYPVEVQNGDEWYLSVEDDTASSLNELVFHFFIFLISSLLALLVFWYEKKSQLHQRELVKSRYEAEEANRAKSEFLASMSHEIRTPMNGVLGMLNLLKNEDLTKEQLRKANIAQSSAESLLTLINDILDFSKIDAGKLDLELLDFNLRSVLEDFVESMVWRCEEKGIELILDMTGITHTTFKGDPGRIRQILTNLVGNAIKFTNLGEIVIRAAISRHTNTNDSNDSSLLFSCSIIDTGIGISHQKLPLLFDAFTQADSSTTRKYGGTGLGLSIVKRLCTLMGGHITVNSEEGKGSNFEFNILLAPGEQSKLVMPEIDTHNLNLLIVDDNKTNREVLCGQLKLWGSNVYEASNSNDALSLLNRHYSSLNSKPIDVAFIDMQMPDIDGAELGRRIRADGRFNDIKLVMMTSMGHKGDANFFAGLGFSAYFSKPTTTSDLFDALAVVVESGAALNQAKPLVTHHYLKTLNENTKNKHKNWPENTRILIVEDNSINQLVAKELLSHLNLSADIAANGQEALDALIKTTEDNTYTLILMDCQMPIMDGYAASRKIRAGEANALYKAIPIIAMTANAMKGDKELCIEAGMNDYLSKPIDPEVLETTLHKWIQ